MHVQTCKQLNLKVVEDTRYFLICSRDQICLVTNRAVDPYPLSIKWEMDIPHTPNVNTILRVGGGHEIEDGEGKLIEKVISNLWPGNR